MIDTTSGNTAPPLAERARAILLTPGAEWQRVAAETDAPMQIFRHYAAPLAAIGPVAQLIGGQVFGYGALGISYRPDLVSALVQAVVTYVLSLASLWVIAWLASQIAPRFGGRGDFPAAFRLVAYAMTASWLAGIAGLVPALAVLALLGLYSLYLLYRGSAPVMGLAQDKALGFTIVTVLAAIAVNIAVALIAAGIASTGAITSGSSA